MCHGDLFSFEFSPYIWKAVKSKKHLFLPAELTTLILRSKNKRCSWKLIDITITCFKGSWQLIDPKTCKLRPENNFPKDNASALRGSSNFQDTHKIVENGKEPNVKPDDKKTDNS